MILQHATQDDGFDGPQPQSEGKLRMFEPNPKQEKQMILKAVSELKSAATLTRSESMRLVAEKLTDDLDKAEHLLQRALAEGVEVPKSLKTRFHDLHSEADKVKNRLRAIEKK